MKTFFTPIKRALDGEMVVDKSSQFVVFEILRIFALSVHARLTRRSALAGVARA